MADLQEITTAARKEAEAGNLERAWELLEEHRDALGEDPAFAWAWLVLAENDPNRHGAARGDLAVILDAWWNHVRIVELGVEQLLAQVDGRPADEPVPEDDPTGLAMEILTECLENLEADGYDGPEVDEETRGSLWNILGNAYRLAGPAHDDDARAAYEKAFGLAPHREWWRFNLGLLYKHRGRWSEGVEVFRELRDLVGDQGPVLFNLAVCATGAGDVDTAVDAWRALGFEPERGEDGLPEVSDLGQVVVRLSTCGIGPEHPGSGEVDYEHVWVQPQSPCHGEVLSATLYDVGADFGDGVLWDGAPVGYRDRDGEPVPRFPVLARLYQGKARTFGFVARQEATSDLTKLSDKLPGLCQLYVFTEQVRFLCRECIRSGGPHGDDHPPPTSAAGEELVYGKLVFVPSDEAGQLSDLAATLERALQAEPALQLAVPGLYRELGDDSAVHRHEELWTQIDPEPE